MNLIKQKLLPAFLLFSFSAIMFLSTSSTTVQLTDSGELITAACRGGVAHPPGYPLFMLLGNMFCQLPWSTAAARVGLISIFAGGWASVALFFVLTRLGASFFVSLIAPLIMVSGSLFWHQSSQAEVFILNAALCLSFVWTMLALAQAAEKKARLLWSAISGVVWGLGLSNHHTAIMLAILLPVLISVSWQETIKRCGLFLLGLIIGLLPYLQLLLANPLSIPHWGDTSTLHGFWRHLLRSDYGTFNLSLPFGEQVSFGAHVWEFLANLPPQFAFILWLSSLVAIVGLLREIFGLPIKNSFPIPRYFKIALLLLPILTGPAFLLCFNIPADGISNQVAVRFFVLPYCLVAILVGLGLNRIEQLITKRSLSRPVLFLFYGILISLMGVTIKINYSNANLRNHLVVDDFVVDALQTVEPNALIISEGDVQNFGVLYAQQMLGLRPDVLFVDARLLLYPWYAQQKNRERPSFNYQFQPGKVFLRQLIEKELRQGTPVYLMSLTTDKIARSFPGYPIGPIFRLLPPGQMPPAPSIVQQMNHDVFAKFKRRGVQPDPLIDPWSASIRESYANTWRSIAEAQLRLGDREAGEYCYAQAKTWAPWRYK